MTDIANATPAAVDIAVGETTVPDVQQKAPKPKVEKPEKPDEAKYKEDLAKAEKEHTIAQEKFDAIRAKLDNSKPGNKDSPTGKRQQELRAELASIRQQQSSFKSSRGSIQDKIVNLDTQLKSRIAEQKAARSRVSFKNVEEVDREIQRLEKQVDAGTMKLVDEKKALAEISSLRKQRKGFAGFEESEKGIADVKTQISELKKTLDNPEQRAISERYNTITKELDTIKAEQDEAFKNLNSLRDERTKLHAEQQTKYSAIRDIKDHYFKAKTAYRDYEQEAYRQRQDRQQQERDAYAKEKRMKTAAAKLEEASAPAYQDEILTAEGLIRYFDPNTPVEQRTLRGPSGLAAEPQRTVNESAFKGTRVSKKEDREENYFVGSGGKKGKKGRKSTESPAPDNGKFNLSMGVIEELGKVNVETPMSQADVPGVVEKLKAKVTKWKADQAEKTKGNIAKAQAEIDRLEAEAQEESTVPAPRSNRTRDAGKRNGPKNAHTNGNKNGAAGVKPEADSGVAIATDDMNAASLEDKTNA